MTLHIDAHKVKYHIPFGEVEYIMVYSATDDNNVNYRIPYIRNFDDKYEEGYEYIIEVMAEKRNKEPINDDLFPYNYSLLQIISKEKKLE
ncbi:MAG: DUF4377 domain-containing protein [Muribaculaceae bacterium]